MELYSETLDPGETKDYAWDWSSKLAAGETVSSHVVTFIDAAGTTSPSNSVAGNVSRVFLNGGTPGKRVIWTIQATTNQSRTFDVALAVDVVENTASGAGDTAVERINAELKAAYALRAKIVAGEAITELWRDGRRVRKELPSLADLNAHILALEGELSAANIAAGATNYVPRRSAIGVFY